MNNQTVGPFQNSLRGVRSSLFSLLLFAVMIGIGELQTRWTGDTFFRWYMPYFAIAFAVWTYVFFYNGRYRFERRRVRLVLFVALSAIAYGAWLLLFPDSENPLVRILIILILSLPAIIELVLNRPILRKTPP